MLLFLLDGWMDILFCFYFVMLCISSILLHSIIVCRDFMAWSNLHCFIFHSILFCSSLFYWPCDISEMAISESCRCVGIDNSIRCVMLCHDIMVYCVMCHVIGCLVLARVSVIRCGSVIQHVV